MEKFKIVLYETTSGRKIVSDFIESFEDLIKTKIHNNLDLLEEYGLKLLSSPLVKKIHQDPSIYELRIKSKLEIRILFYFYKPNYFIILHGFVKKTKKTSRKDIKLAGKRFKEFT